MKRIVLTAAFVAFAGAASACELTPIDGSMKSFTTADCDFKQAASMALEPLKAQ